MAWILAGVRVPTASGLLALCDMMGVKAEFLGVLASYYESP